MAAIEDRVRQLNRTAIGCVCMCVYELIFNVNIMDNLMAQQMKLKSFDGIGYVIR